MQDELSQLDESVNQIVSQQNSQQVCTCFDHE